MRSAIKTIVASLVASSSALAWPGHSWERWRRVTTTTRPSVTSPQAGRQDLVPLLRTGGTDSPQITTVRQWEDKRRRILAVLEEVLGRPTSLTVPKPESVELDRTNLEDHVRVHIRIRAEPDDWIPAYLLVPRPEPEAPAPIVIVLHQTVRQGKDEPAGLKGDRTMMLARELVARGVTCLVPDVIGFGERIPPGAEVYDGIIEFFRRHPGWSVMGKMCWDLSRCVDYIETLSWVDPKRVGCIGHSHGAYGTIFGAAFEPRIACAAASCGFTTLRADPRPDRWSELTPLIPQIGYYLPDVAAIPFDWHEIIALIAPRPFLNWATLNDSIFPRTENLRDVFAQLEEVYALYGAADRLAWRLAPGEHRFPDEARRWAYEWMEKQLGVAPTSRPAGR